MNRARESSTPTVRRGWALVTTALAGVLLVAGFLSPWLLGRCESIAVGLAGAESGRGSWQARSDIQHSDTQHAGVPPASESLRQQVGFEALGDLDEELPPWGEHSPANQVPAETAEIPVYFNEADLPQDTLAVLEACGEDVSDLNAYQHAVVLHTDYAKGTAVVSLQALFRQAQSMEGARSFFESCIGPHAPDGLDDASVQAAVSYLEDFMHVFRDEVRQVREAYGVESTYREPCMSWALQWQHRKTQALIACEEAVLPQLDAASTQLALLLGPPQDGGQYFDRVLRAYQTTSPSGD